jgi:transcription antitermination factor NusG
MTQIEVDHPFVAAILGGEHDDEIDLIQQACSARLKRRFRKGTRIEVTSGSLMGATGVVIKVNPKRISVDLGADGQWNIPPTMLRSSL